MNCNIYFAAELLYLVSIIVPSDVCTKARLSAFLLHVVIVLFFGGDAFLDDEGPHREIHGAQSFLKRRCFHLAPASTGDPLVGISLL